MKLGKSHHQLREIENPKKGSFGSSLRLELEKHELHYHRSILMFFVKTNYK